MFHNIGANVITFEFETFSNNEWHDFDYLSNLKESFGVKQNHSLQFTNEEGLIEAESRMCYLFPEHPLRVSARLGSISKGWVEMRQNSPVICE